MSRAQEQAAYLIGDRGLLELAESEGRRIIEDAEVSADAVRAGADDYAFNLLATLESEVSRALSGVQKGIAVLDDRRAELAAAPPSALASTGDPDDDARPDVDDDDGYDEDADEDEVDDEDPRALRR